MFRTLLNSAVISLSSFPISGIVALGSAIQRLRISPSFSSMSSFLALCDLKDTDNSSGCLAVDCVLRSNMLASLSVVSSGTDILNERLGHFFLVRTDDWSRILLLSIAAITLGVIFGIIHCRAHLSIIQKDTSAEENSILKRGPSAPGAGRPEAITDPISNTMLAKSISAPRLRHTALSIDSAMCTWPVPADEESCDPGFVQSSGVLVPNRLNLPRVSRFASQSSPPSSPFQVPGRVILARRAGHNSTGGSMIRPGTATPSPIQEDPRHPQFIVYHHLTEVIRQMEVSQSVGRHILANVEVTPKLEPSALAQQNCTNSLFAAPVPMPKARPLLASVPGISAVFQRIPSSSLAQRDPAAAALVTKYLADANCMAEAARRELQATRKAPVKIVHGLSSARHQGQSRGARQRRKEQQVGPTLTQ